MHELRTTGEVIDALGGTAKCARLLGRPPQVISNWRRSPNFPPEMYLALTAILAGRGKTAPASLWRMESPPRPAPAEGAAA
jgi:hypothetical protein